MQNDANDNWHHVPADEEIILRSGRQDKNADERERAPKTFSVTHKKPARSHPKRQTEYVMLWVKRGVKRELQRIADAEGLSLSRTGAAALEEWLAQRLHMQHAGLLQPIIERAIATHMRAYSSRIATLLVRSMFESEQTRAIATNILARQQGVTQAVLEQILDGSSDTARRNITRVTPQLESLIREVERWLERSAEATQE
ncbi:MAG TPA: hypothetical protein VH599_07260 [Ktedonobacterales bacterium]|jgi:hypothetical protein